MNILIVEDDHDIASLTSMILADAGYRVQTFEDDFIALITEPVASKVWADIDVAVVDLMLPGLAGSEILKYVAENHHRIRRLVSTASSPSVTPEVVALADEIIYKPYRASDLLDAVSRK